MNADPDPATQINADQCGSGYGSGSETLVRRVLGQLRVRRLLVLEVAGVVGRAGGLPSGPILSGLSGTEQQIPYMLGGILYRTGEGERGWVVPVLGKVTFESNDYKLPLVTYKNFFSVTVTVT